MDLSIRPTDVDCLIRMNSNYFLSQGVPVLGGIFNRGDLDGFYHYASCGEHITRFFAMNRGRESVFGVIPEVPALNGLREKVGMMMLAGESKDGGAPRGEAAAEDGRQQLLALAEENISNVAAHVDVEGRTDLEAAIRAESRNPPALSVKPCYCGETVRYLRRIRAQYSAYRHFMPAHADATDPNLLVGSSRRQ